MLQTRVFNILDFMELAGEDITNIILSSFSCQHNPEIENYLKNNAIQFAKKKNAIVKLTEAQHIVGGGVIFLECEDNEKLLSFYQNEHNNYQVYGERVSESENITYKQLLRFF